MKKEDVMGFIGKALPFIGAAATGNVPALVALAAKEIGDAIGSKVEPTPDGIAAAVANATPEQFAAIRQAEQNFALKMRELGYKEATELAKLSTENATDINTTMRAEAASEHWPTYGWRPAIGFAVAFVLLASAVVVLTAYVGAMWSGNAKPLEYLPGMLAAMAGLVAVASPILGIASWFRGKMQADPGVPTVNRG